MSILTALWLWLAELSPAALWPWYVPLHIIVGAA